jgi:glycine cleavage system aminomethyltransferase T
MMVDPLIEKVFEHSPAYPWDPKVGLYVHTTPRYPEVYTYTGWQDENMAWKDACAIFAGLSVNPVARLTGPDVIRLLSDATTNSFAHFPIGRIKHTIMCDDEGRILTHGLAVRIAEDEVQAYTLTPWLNYAATKGQYDVTFEDRQYAEFNFQCTGPRTLEVLEAATGECLHDIEFMAWRPSSIHGKPVRIYRMGMSGNLAYEVHGAIEDARELYTAVVEAGQPFGLKRIGWLSYASQHPDGGYPQEAYTFYTACMQDKGFVAFLEAIGVNPDIWPGHPIMCGSSGPDPTRHFRNPVELGWHHSITLDHEFRGKAAIERELAQPTRKTVTLIWNVEDVMDVYASLFQRDVEPYRYMDFPIEPFFVTMQAGGRHYMDEVLKGGRVVGYSSGRDYSLRSRDMFSIGTVQVEHAGLGTELTVLWGEPGSRQKEIRVVVARFPHIDLPLNSEVDVSTIPCIRGTTLVGAGT